jgi:hypothetical protein
MALKGQIAHSENVRTRTEAGALDVAEYFHVMLWIGIHAIINKSLKEPCENSFAQSIPEQRLIN